MDPGTAAAEGSGSRRSSVLLDAAMTVESALGPNKPRTVEIAVLQTPRVAEDGTIAGGGYADREESNHENGGSASGSHTASASSQALEEYALSMVKHVTTPRVTGGTPRTPAAASAIDSYPVSSSAAGSSFNSLVGTPRRLSRGVSDTDSGLLPERKRDDEDVEAGAIPATPVPVSLDAASASVTPAVTTPTPPEPAAHPPAQATDDTEEVSWGWFKWRRKKAVQAQVPTDEAAAAQAVKSASSASSSSAAPLSAERAAAAVNAAATSDSTKPSQPPPTQPAASRTSSRAEQKDPLGGTPLPWVHSLVRGVINRLGGFNTLSDAEDHDPRYAVVLERELITIQAGSQEMAQAHQRSLRRKDSKDRTSASGAATPVRSRKNSSSAAQCAESSARNGVVKVGTGTMKQRSASESGADGASSSSSDDSDDDDSDDGSSLPVLLEMSHYYPAGLYTSQASLKENALPVIVIRTPYDRSLMRHTAERIVQRGYHCVVQDTRGSPNAQALRIRQLQQHRRQKEEAQRKRGEERAKRRQQRETREKAGAAAGASSAEQAASSSTAFATAATTTVIPSAVTSTPALDGSSAERAPVAEATSSPASAHVAASTGANDGSSAPEAAPSRPLSARQKQQSQQALTDALEASVSAASESATSGEAPAAAAAPSWVAESVAAVVAASAPSPVAPAPPPPPAAVASEMFPIVHESLDGLATLLWLREQPWCDGNISFYGASYLGITQYAVVDHCVPEVKCLAPVIAPSRVHGVIYPHGSFALDLAARWMFIMFHPSITGITAALPGGAGSVASPVTPSSQKNNAAAAGGKQSKTSSAEESHARGLEAAAEALMPKRKRSVLQPASAAAPAAAAAASSTALAVQEPLAQPPSFWARSYARVVHGRRILPQALEHLPAAELDQCITEGLTTLPFFKQLVREGHILDCAGDYGEEFEKNPFWREKKSKLCDLSNAPPLLIVEGWYDLFLREALRDYVDALVVYKSWQSRLFSGEVTQAELSDERARTTVRSFRPYLTIIHSAHIDWSDLYRVSLDESLRWWDFHLKSPTDPSRARGLADRPENRSVKIQMISASGRNRERHLALVKKRRQEEAKRQAEREKAEAAAAAAAAATAQQAKPSADGTAAAASAVVPAVSEAQPSVPAAGPADPADSTHSEPGDASTAAAAAARKARALAAMVDAEWLYFPEFPPPKARMVPWYLHAVTECRTKGSSSSAGWDEIEVRSLRREPPHRSDVELGTIVRASSSSASSSSAKADESPVLRAVVPSPPPAAAAATVGSEPPSLLSPSPSPSTSTPIVTLQVVPAVGEEAEMKKNKGLLALLTSAPTPPPPIPPPRPLDYSCYLYDPRDPTPVIGGATFDIENSGSLDTRPMEGRSDVLVFTSEPLTAPLVVVGFVKCVLYVRSNVSCTDFIARLCDVYPLDDWATSADWKSGSGRSQVLCDGLCKVTPMKVNRLTVEKGVDAETARAMKLRKRKQSTPLASPSNTSRAVSGGPSSSQANARSVSAFPALKPFTSSPAAASRDRLESLGGPFFSLTEPDLTMPLLKLEVDMWATGNVFQVGHRIRLHVCSAAHPRWLRSLGGADPMFHGLEAAKLQHQTVYHDADHPSALFLPVLNP